MIAVQAAGIVLTVDFTPGMTAAKLVDTLMQENQLEIRGGWLLSDAHDQGRAVAPDEELIDGRFYWLNAWFWKHLANS